jgi:hypothetical protein
MLPPRLLPVPRLRPARCPAGPLAAPFQAESWPCLQLACHSGLTGPWQWPPCPRLDPTLGPAAALLTLNKVSMDARQASVLASI